MSKMTFETLKERAKRALDARIARCDPQQDPLGFDGDNAVRLLIPYALLDDDARAALRALAQAAPPGSRLEQRAHAHAEAGRTDWSQWLLQTRRTGHRRIDGWDVRCVAHLIAHLPECVTTSQRRAALTCYAADDGEAWIVEFTEHGARAAKSPPPWPCSERFA